MYMTLQFKFTSKNVYRCRKELTGPATSTNLKQCICELSTKIFFTILKGSRQYICNINSTYSHLIMGCNLGCSPHNLKHTDPNICLINPRWSLLRSYVATNNSFARSSSMPSCLMSLDFLLSTQVFVFLQLLSHSTCFFFYR